MFVSMGSETMLASMVFARLKSCNTLDLYIEIDWGFVGYMMASLGLT